MIDAIKMIRVYTKTTIKAWFQYKMDAVLKPLTVFLREATGIIVIYLTLLKFDSLNGWDTPAMMFLFSFLFLTYGVLIIFFTGLRDFGSMVQTGSFDRLLLRPRGLLFQVTWMNADWFAAIGHGGLGLVLFLVSAGNVGVTWDIYKAVYCLLAVVGGVLIQGAVFLVFASACFYLIKTDSLRGIFYYNLRKFAGYPISIYHKIIQVMLMFIVPFAFVNYFPAQYFLRMPDLQDYPPVFIYLSPVVGVCLYLLAYVFWRYSLRHYKSSGN